VASGPEASHAGRCQLIENQAQATFAPPLTRPLVFVNLMRDFGSRVVSDDVGTDQKFLVETIAVHDRGGCLLPIRTRAAILRRRPRHAHNPSPNFRSIAASLSSSKPPTSRD
jgi:hypothetical protein